MNTTFNSANGLHRWREAMLRLFDAAAACLFTDGIGQSGAECGSDCSVSKLQLCVAAQATHSQ